MYPKPIAEYFAPTNLAEALALRAAHPASAILAGGQSLLPRMKARQVAPRTLLDLNRVQDLCEVVPTAQAIRIGALVRHRAAATHPVLHRHAAVLADAALAIGDLQVRNRGTLVGSVCFAEPTGDIAPAAMALGAHLRLESAARGARLLPVSGFEAGAIRADEIATQLEFLTTDPRAAGAYRKIGRVAQDRAIVGVAVQVRWDAAGNVHRAAIAIGGLAPGPQLAPAAARALIGGVLNAESAAHAGRLAADEVSAQDDSMASGAYRRRLIQALVPEALLQARARALGETR